MRKMNEYDYYKLKSLIKVIGYLEKRLEYVQDEHEKDAINDLIYDLKKMIAYIFDFIYESDISNNKSNEEEISKLEGVL